MDGKLPKTGGVRRFLQGTKASAAKKASGVIEDWFGNREFWSTGLYVSICRIQYCHNTKYIQKQEKQDQIEDSLSKKEYEESFKSNK